MDPYWEESYLPPEYQSSTDMQARNIRALLFEYVANKENYRSSGDVMPITVRCYTLIIQRAFIAYLDGSKDPISIHVYCWRIQSTAAYSHCVIKKSAFREIATWYCYEDFRHIRWCDTCTLDNIWRTESNWYKSVGICVLDKKDADGVTNFIWFKTFKTSVSYKRSIRWEGLLSWRYEGQVISIPFQRVEIGKNRFMNAAKTCCSTERNQGSRTKCSPSTCSLCSTINTLVFTLGHIRSSVSLSPGHCDPRSLIMPICSWQIWASPELGSYCTTWKIRASKEKIQW